MNNRPYHILQSLASVILVLSISLITACGGSSPEEEQTDEKSQLENPDWLVNAHVQLNFVEDSHDLDWQAFGFYSSTKDAHELTFEYGPTPTHDSDIPVQWNLTWVNGLDGAAYATPFILYKVSDLTPGTYYYPRAMVEVESNRSLESYDGGHGPEFVLGAFGASPELVEEDGTEMHVLQVNNRTLNRDADTTNLGFTDIPEEYLDGEYVIKRIVSDLDAISVEANEDGEIWLLLAVYSGHMGESVVHVKRLAFDW